jgi:hypothetical protein
VKNLNQIKTVCYLLSWGADMFRSRLTPLFLCMLPAFFLLFSPPLSGAELTATLLQEIRFSQKSDTEETVTFKMNGPNTPKIFTIKGSTPKIVVDFYDTSTAPAIKSLMDSRGKVIKAIRTGIHTDNQIKTRVVLDLVPAAEYDFSQNFEAVDNTLRLTVMRVQGDGGKKPALQEAPEKVGKRKDPEKVSAEASPPAVTQAAVPPAVTRANGVGPSSVVAAVDPNRTAAVPPTSLPVSIRSVSFEKQPDKGEKVLFSVDNFQPPRVIGVEEGIPRVICDFTSATLAEAIPALIPAQGEFIQQILVETKENSSIRIILELVPNRHYDLEQLFFKDENLYVLLVKPSEGKQLKKPKS